MADPTVATRITDVFVPDLVPSYNSLRSLAKNAFLASGVAVFNPALEVLMNASMGGSKIIMPFWKPLGEDDPNVGSDNPDVKSVAKKHSAGTEIASKTFLNQSWTVMDLSGILAGDDPASDIVSKIEEYWNIVLNKRLLSTAAGIIADSIASHDSDLILDITEDGDGLIGAESIIEACGYLGDRQDETSIMVMHSTIYNNLRQQNLIEFIRDSDNNTQFATYQGMRVLKDDNMPLVVVTPAVPAVPAEGENPAVPAVPAVMGYHTYIFGPGVFSVGSGYPGIQEEMDRKPDAGNGMGQEVLYTRRCFVTHPNFYSVAVEDTNVGLTNTALAAATTWTRVVDERKRINFVAILSLG